MEVVEGVFAVEVDPVLELSSRQDFAPFGDGSATEGESEDVPEPLFSPLSDAFFRSPPPFKAITSRNSLFIGFGLSCSACS